MKNSIATIFLSIGLSCGITAAALTYLTQSERCERIVVYNLEHQKALAGRIASMVQPTDFLTTLTQKGK
jgi:hypothetical protein